MIAILCPGQGSQAPGMLRPWLDAGGAAAAERLSEYSRATGTDLERLGTTGDADEIKDTAVAQPLIVAASLISLGILADRVGAPATWAQVTAGHSVGEYAAATVAGVLSETDALALVATRGRAMAEAAAQTPTGMAAVVGGQPEAVTEALQAHGLVPANVNGGGQVVAAGTLEALDALREDAPARTRVIPLAVAGAFHTEYMRSAVDVVAAAADALTPADPVLDLLTNADGTAVGSGSDALAAMVAQIARPVRWDLCQETLAQRGVTAAIELAPAGVLRGLARRTLREVEVVALTGPDDLDAASDLIARHAQES